jgi:hypothetical protein
VVRADGSDHGVPDVWVVVDEAAWLLPDRKGRRKALSVSLMSDRQLKALGVFGIALSAVVAPIEATVAAAVIALFIDWLFNR